MKIAVEGCCHGELNSIYEAVADIERAHGFKIDLLICCGDFQCVRDECDLQNLACPPKYRHLKDFHEYYKQIKYAPVLTIFVGGNHEAPNVLQQLYYGGWVAPNMFYMGHSGVLNIGGIRIAGLSGIYKADDYKRGYFEFPPYNPSTQRSAYHMRECEVKKLSAVTPTVDIVVSHDWPNGIEKYGDLKTLTKIKPYFKDEIANNNLGNPASAGLLEVLKPKFWFAAHLHVKYAALMSHDDGTVTRFLALDKVLPNRQFLQILEIDPSYTTGYSIDVKKNSDVNHSDVNQSDVNHSDVNHSDVCSICFDIEWLAILKANANNIPIGPAAVDFIINYPKQDDIDWVIHRLEEKGVKQNNNKEYLWPSWTALPHTDLDVQRNYMVDLLDITEDMISEECLAKSLRTVTFVSQHHQVEQKVMAASASVLKTEEIDINIDDLI